MEMNRIKSATLRNQDAFTIVELLVVLLTVSFIAVLILPALASTHPNVQATRCINNMRQLGAAMAMYTHDNFDLFPPNPDTPGSNWVTGSAGGWMPDINAGGSTQAGNPDFVTNSSYSLFAPYIRNNADVFQCPADPRICPYSGSDSSSIGQPIKVIRSVSLNAGIGTDPRLGQPANVKVNGPWLDGNHTHSADTPYATFGKTGDFRRVRPADIWTFVDDDPWTINDGCMAVIAASPDTVNYCSVLHNNSTPFAFADSHAEMHKWKSTIWIHTGFPSRAAFEATGATGLGREDWSWWASHATRNLVTGSVP